MVGKCLGRVPRSFVSLDSFVVRCVNPWEVFGRFLMCLGHHHKHRVTACSAHCHPLIPVAGVRCVRAHATHAAAVLVGRRAACRTASNCWHRARSARLLLAALRACCAEQPGLPLQCSAACTATPDVQPRRTRRVMPSPLMRTARRPAAAPGRQMRASASSSGIAAKDVKWPISIPSSGVDPSLHVMDVDLLRALNITQCRGLLTC